ncbi:MAG: 4a-hydroxytetrahydrobiopterin dehydratase [Verrucomicrobia bacterium]|nr:4a-hydroxytetrahydrobiopterin dehydratase [Verrucomicrobiota bacterium]
MDAKCKLSSKKCVPCSKGTPPLKGQQLADLYKRLGNGWSLIEERCVEKEYRFPDFRQALTFTNHVGELAEQEGHHPDIFLAYGKVKLQFWTHKIHGLSESDFIMAAKCDELLS